MANEHETLTGLFADVANAIREKTGKAGEIVADRFPEKIRAIPAGAGLPVEAEILETVCEGVQLDDDNPSYTLPAPIALDAESLYFLSYQYFGADGQADPANNGYGYSKVDGELVRWLTADENNSVTLTSTGVADTWRGSGKSAIISIYRVKIAVKDDLQSTALNYEGYFTAASGQYSHAEGKNTVAGGLRAHAEGSTTTASGTSAHAEGGTTVASGTQSHAEGGATTASGVNSHAEGYGTVASGVASHAEGGAYADVAGCSAIGYGAHAEGISTTARGKYAHAEGDRTVAEDWGHAEGFQSTASGVCAHAEGGYTTAAGGYSHAEGSNTKASGEISHAEGNMTIASSFSAHAEGQKCTASEPNSHAEGLATTACASDSHAEGMATIASGVCSHAEGFYTVAEGDNSHAGGSNTIAAGNCQTAIGCFNVKTQLDTDKFIIGKGTSDNARTNCLRVTDTGVFASGVYASSGADYAEMFEWLDGNPEGDDRVGRFVTLEGEKIRLAGPEDTFILGIVSGNPSVVGGVHDDQWQGMYLTDIFGRPVMEDAEVPAETVERPDPEDPEKTVVEVICPARVERRQKLNPDYKSGETYLPRSKRPEWDAVGMLGKLVVVDDGTCEVNGWAAVGQGGVATHSEGRTKYRVMARLDENHVRILML